MKATMSKKKNDGKPFKCSLCLKGHYSPLGAKICLEQGIVGPKIDSGILLGRGFNLNSYSIFIRELPSIGHQRQYQFIDFRYPKPNGFCKYTFSAKEFEEDLENQNFSILDEVRFEQIQGFIWKEKGSSKLRKELKELGVKGFSRHSQDIENALREDDDEDF